MGCGHAKGKNSASNSEGKPEKRGGIFDGVAQEVRELMAQLGIRKFDDLVGRTDLLEVKPLEEFPEELRPRIAGLQLDKLLYQVDPSGTAPKDSHQRDAMNDLAMAHWDDRIVGDAKVALNAKGNVKLEYRITNVMRNIGTHVSGIIGYSYGR